MHSTVEIKIKSIFLLLVFTFLKVGIAHSLSHTFLQDDIHDCDVCILIADTNKTNIFDAHLLAHDSDLLKKEFVSKTCKLLYKTPKIREQHFYFFLNKPPPFRY